MNESKRLFRVDPRLIHATLMNAWVPAVRAEQLVVIDEAVCADNRQMEILRLAAGDLAVVFTEPRRAALALAGLPQERSMVLLFSTLDGVEEAMDYALDVRELNIGHLPAGPGRRAVGPSIHLGDAELAGIQRLLGRGVEVRVQALPDDAPVPLSVLGLTETTPSSPPEVAPSESAGDDVCEAELTIVNERGLHLRAAHVLANLATEAAAEVEVGQDGLMVNAKSLLGLTTLGAVCGSSLRAVVRGPDAAKTMDALKQLFASGFGEGAE